MGEDGRFVGVGEDAIEVQVFWHEGRGDFLSGDLSGCRLYRASVAAYDRRSNAGDGVYIFFLSVRHDIVAEWGVWYVCSNV